MTAAMLSYLSRTITPCASAIALLEAALIASHRPPCPHCSGSGVVRRIYGYNHDCPVCLGSGITNP
jgi:DnaJ-class molecular chaperone